jgi:hypothetical protein
MVPKHNVTCLHGPAQRRAQHKINMFAGHLDSTLFGLFSTKLSDLGIHVFQIEPFSEPFGLQVVVGITVLLLDVSPDNIKISFGMPYKVKHGLN